MVNHKIKFILFISGLLLGAFLITSFTSYFVSLKSLRSEIEQNSLPLTSDNVYSEIQRDLIKPVFISSVMANNTFLRDWILNGEKDESQIQNYLNKIKNQYGAFTSFFVSDKTIKYYYYGGVLKTVSPDAWRDKWYFRVREMKPNYEINCDPDMANKDAMTIFVNHKVFDYKGNFIGATGVGLTANAVQLLIEKYQIKYHRTIFFADKTGKIILGTGINISEGANIKTMQGISSVADLILSSDNNKLVYKNDGKTFHLNTRFVPELQWYLVVEQSEEEAIKLISHALVINLLISLAVTAAMVLVINFSINIYRRNIRRTEKFARAEIKQAEDTSRRKEIEIGVEIQQQLLLGEPPHNLSGAIIEAKSVPSQQISGDFYDFIQYDNRHFDLFMGDVMGKGISAALCGAATKIQFLRAFYDLAAEASNVNLPPLDKVVSTAHNEMCGKLINIESFITACVARIDLDDKRIDIIDCGHTATLLYHGHSGECELIKGPNCPLGFFRDEKFEVQSARFNPGDIIMFYSDGVIEAKKSQDNLFGTDRLMEFVKNNVSCGPKEMIARLYDELKSFSSSANFQDDVTCIVIKIAD